MNLLNLNYNCIYVQTIPFSFHNECFLSLSEKVKQRGPQGSLEGEVLPYIHSEIKNVIKSNIWE